MHNPECWLVALVISAEGFAKNNAVQKYLQCVIIEILLKTLGMGKKLSRNRRL